MSNTARATDMGAGLTKTQKGLFAATVLGLVLSVLGSSDAHAALPIVSTLQVGSAVVQVAMPSGGAEARVIIDGHDRGTAATSHAVAPGSHSVIVLFADQTQQRRDIVVQAGDSVTLEVDRPTPSVAWLRVMAPSASVFVDGQPISGDDAQAVVAGPHRVDLVFADGRRSSRAFTVAPGESIVVRPE